MTKKYKKWTSTSKTYIPCDICGKKLLFTRRNRQRCSNKGKGKKNTECQKEAARRLMRGEIPTKRRGQVPTRRGNVKSGCECLKCGERFKPVGKYNRICEGCGIENERYREVCISHSFSLSDLD